MLILFTNSLLKRKRAPIMNQTENALPLAARSTVRWQKRANSGGVDSTHRERTKRTHESSKFEVERDFHCWAARWRSSIVMPVAARKEVAIFIFCSSAAASAARSFTSKPSITARQLSRVPWLAARAIALLV